MKHDDDSKMGNIPKASKWTLRRYNIGKYKLFTYQLIIIKKVNLVVNEKK